MSCHDSMKEKGSMHCYFAEGEEGRKGVKASDEPKHTTSSWIGGLCTRSYVYKGHFFETSHISEENKGQACLRYQFQGITSNIFSETAIK